MSILQTFCKAQRLVASVVLGADDEPVIIGHTGSIYVHGNDRLAVAVMLDSSRRWGSLRRNCEQVAMTILADGDSEGALSFDASNATQAALAISAAGLKQRRTASSAQRAALAVARSKRTLIERK